MLTLRASLTCLALAAGVGAAVAQTGNVEAVKPAAASERGGDVRTLVVGDDVAVGETVATGDDGRVLLLFDDETELVVGPRSRLTIDDYLVRRDGSAGRFAINALSGTYRFVTGNSPSNAYEIKTPTGTVAVRGTAFDFAVADLESGGLGALYPTLFASGQQTVTLLLLYEGSVDICNTAGDCATLTAGCQIGAMSDLDAVEIVNQLQARNELRAYFPYAMNQSPLLRPFWVVGARDCLIAPPTQPGEVVAAAAAEGEEEPPPPPPPYVPPTTPPVTPPTTPPPTTPPPTTPGGPSPIN